MKLLSTILFTLISLIAGTKEVRAGNGKDSTMPMSRLLPDNSDRPANSLAVLNCLLESGVASRTVLSWTRMQRPVVAYYFPGTSNRKALVIGGVHGSELSAIDVVKQVAENLTAGNRPYYHVIVIPCLFPDNAATAEENPAEIGSVKNIGRYTDGLAADPNRQMPLPGSSFLEDIATDMAGRVIEPENQLLLRLIQFYQPHRIASVHAIRNTASAGVFADPRTDCNGMALGYTADSTLAIRMAKRISLGGGVAPGNHLSVNPTSLYHCDPPAAKEGEKQHRNIHGSQLPGNRGYGVSLGSWASTGSDLRADEAREAATMLTIEFPGSRRVQDYGVADQIKYKRYTEAYAAAISEVFVEK